MSISVISTRSAPADDSFDGEFSFLMHNLQDDVRERLKASITVCGIETAIDVLLTAGKTPGPDGLGAKFHKEFRSEAAEALYQVLTEAYCKRMLSPSFLGTHTVFIPKVDDLVKIL